MPKESTKCVSRNAKIPVYHQLRKYFSKNVLSKNLNYSEFPLINQKPLITLSIGKTRTFEIEKMKDQYGKIAPNIN